MLAGAEIVRVAVPDVVMLVAEIVTVRAAGNVEFARVTRPVNPSRAVTVRVEVHDEPPAIREISSGLAEILKSGPTNTVMSIVALNVGLNATIVRSWNPSEVPGGALTVNVEVPGPGNETDGGANTASRPGGLDEL